MKKVMMISTGGTIEKTYCELSGILDNDVSVLDIMLESLDLMGVQIERMALMNKDSLEMNDGDHSLIAATALQGAQTYDGVVIVHGTDRLTHTGERILEMKKSLDCPIVLTGAMRPYALRNTDAVQNLVEALLAVQICPPGVYCAMHNQVLEFPGVKKNRAMGTFVKD